MYLGKKIAVVIPAYMEAEHIEETIEGIPAFVDNVIVVDDASYDQTFQLAKSSCQKMSSDRQLFEVFRFERNVGVGGAIIMGHKIALKRDCDISVVMDGDNQMDPVYIPQLIEPIIRGTAHFTKGNRFYAFSALQGMPKYRIIGNLMLSLLMKFSTGYWHIKDPQNGYTAISALTLRRIPLDRIQQRYDFANDLLIWLSIYHVKIEDVNIPARYGSETSTIVLSDFIVRVLRTILRGVSRRVIWSLLKKRKNHNADDAD
jgi:glycosyltransferase involved in cell wall biosynthesis